MKFYHAPKAVNPERVALFLKAKGQEGAVEIEEVSIMKGEHKMPEYRTISPFAQVPALVLDDGTAITESRAICEYIEGLFPDPNLLGANPKERSQVTMWDRRVEMMWMMPFAFWFRNAHEMMAPLENPQVPEQAEKSEKAVKAFVKRLADHLEREDFIAAGRFSIADITGFAVCGFCGVMQWKPHEEHASIGAWRDRVKGEIFANA
ncbi:MAG: glutathione S-transferase family protein [Pseudomonadota bacterium]